MRHFATPQFWEYYRNLPEQVRSLANKQFKLLKADPNHPSLHFKMVGRFRSARVGLFYRALAVETPDGFVWFWIGSHQDYDKLLDRQH